MEHVATKQPVTANLEVSAMKRIMLLYLLPFFFVLGIVRTAQADGEPVEGRDYWILPQTQCDSGTCIRIAPGININTPRLAEKLGVKPIDIRADNPTGTIALCHRKNDGYRMGTITRPEERASNEVWKSCPDPEQQYVYILPGQVIKLTGVKHLSFHEEEQLKAEIKQCTTSECATQVARKWGAKIAGASSASTPAQGVDPIVAELTACTTTDCAVAVAKKAGASIAIVPPTDGDNLLAELKACGADDACKNMALQAHDLEPIKPAAAPNANPERGSAGQAFWLAAGSLYRSVFIVLTALCIIYLTVVALKWRKRFKVLKDKFDEKIDEELTDLRAGFNKELTKLNTEKTRFKNRLDDEVAEKKNLADKMQKVFDSLREFSDKYKVPLPRDLSLLEAWRLTRQYFEDKAVEYAKIGQANEELSKLNREVAERAAACEQRADECARRAAEAEARAGEFERKFNSQVAGNSQNAEIMVRLQEQNQMYKSSLDDWEKNKLRCREVFDLLNQADSELIALDNALTDLVGEHTRAMKELLSLEAQGSPGALKARAEILAMEGRVKDLIARREELLKSIETNLAPVRQEFMALQERLAGFRLDRLDLYNETQRDRNDITVLVGELQEDWIAFIKESGALLKSIRDERREMDELRKGADAALAQREQALNDKEQELVKREIAVGDNEAAWRRVMRPLFAILDMDLAPSIEDIRKLGGTETLIDRQVEAYAKLKDAYRDLEQRCAQLEAVQTTPSMRTSDASVDPERRVQEAELLLRDREKTIAQKEEKIIILTNERDQALGQVQALEEKIAGLEERIAYLEPFEIAARSSLRPSPVPRDMAALVAQEADPQISIRLEAQAPDEPVPTSITRKTLGYGGKTPAETRVVPIGSQPADNLLVDKFFDLADQLVKANRGVKVDSQAKVRTLQLLLTEVPVEFDFEGIFKNDSPFSSNATSILNTRGEDYVRSKLNGSRGLLAGIQWLIDACGIPELGPPQTDRALSPG